MSKQADVIITVTGGVAEIQDYPPDIEVVIIDFDNGDNVCSNPECEKEIGDQESCPYCGSDCKRCPRCGSPMFTTGWCSNCDYEEG